MKTKLLYIAFLLTAHHYFSQNVNFVDNNFKNVLLPFNDVNGDGQISLTEASNITSIFIDVNHNITNLSGIESFTNLTSIIIKNNQINSHVDLSQNIKLYNVQIQNLVVPSVNLTGLTKLKYLSVGVPLGGIIDLTNKPLLEDVLIGGSFNTGGIYTIDVTQSPLLKKLFLSNCSLTSLNVTQNPILETLIIQKGAALPGSISAINLTQNPLLKYVAILSQPALATLNTSLNPLLETINIGATGITSLNLNNNPLLKYLSMGHNNFSGGIDLSPVPLLETFNAPNAMLSALDFTNNVNLKYISITNNTISNVNLTTMPLLNTFEAGNNHFTSINLSQNPKLGYVSFLSNQFMKYINIKNGFNNLLTWQTNLDYQFMPQLTGVCVDNPTSQYATLVKQVVGANVLVTANCSLLSSQEIEMTKKKLTIYPMPAVDILNVQTKENLVAYSILSITGQRIKEGNFRVGEKSLRVDDLLKGIYIVEIKTDKKIYTEKMIKN